MNNLKYQICLLITGLMASSVSIVFAQTGNSGANASTQSKLVFCCDETNDLYQVVSSKGMNCRRFDQLEMAIDAAPVGAGILVLADGYPQQTTDIDAAIFESASEKHLRLFIEYPSSLPNIQIGQPRDTSIERVVVSSDFFGNKLAQSRIVSVNGLHYVPLIAEESHLVAARVAGFDSAVFGIPENNAPILFEMQTHQVLVSTTKLSHFVTGRYAPKESWQEIWEAILTWLDSSQKELQLDWTPSVRPSYKRDDTLPVDYEKQAFEKGIDWFKKAKMIVHNSVNNQIVGKDRIQSLPKDTPVGDGT